MFSSSRKLLGVWETCPLWCSFAICRISRLPWISSFKKILIWVGIVLLISSFSRRFSGGAWFIQDRFTFTGSLIIKAYHPYIDRSLNWQPMQVTQAIHVGQGAQNFCWLRNFGWTFAIWKWVEWAQSEHRMSIVWALKYLY